MYRNNTLDEDLLREEIDTLHTLSSNTNDNSEKQKYVAQMSELQVLHYEVFGTQYRPKTESQTQVSVDLWEKAIPLPIPEEFAYNHE